MLTLVVLLIVLISTRIIGVLGGILVSFAVPIAIFWYGKKKIKKNGTVVIDNLSSDFKLEEKEVKVAYADIASYQIERFNGCSLVIKFRDGTKFKLMANSTFSNHLYLGVVLDSLDKMIREYKANNNVVIERKPSIFERKWMLPLLIVLTSAIAVMIVASLSGGKPMPTSFYTSMVFLIMMWVGWVSARKGKK